MVKHFPVLYGQDSKGRTKVWHICVTDEYEFPTIVTFHGLETGEKQRSDVTVRQGKNLGKANETSAWDQALSEAESKWNKKQDSGYAEKGAKVTQAPRAMLAHPFDKRKKNISWPAYVQPKMDGIRLIAEVVSDSKVEYWSRNGKQIKTADHLTEHILTHFPQGTVLDGELFNPQMTLQDIVSGAKKLSEKSAKLQYHIYDVIMGGGFDVRTRFIHDRIGNTQAIDTPLVCVTTFQSHSERSMRESHGLFVEAGFEGTIVRNMDGPYKQGHRSADLLKLKDFQDDEFEIIGGKDGVGKEEGKVTFRCITADGVEFDARPRGTDEQRAEWFTNLSKLVGKKLTVRFVYYTPDGVPFHPVGLAIRDYE